LRDSRSPEPRDRMHDLISVLFHVSNCADEGLDEWQLI
jgi:hypothetical protein